MLTPTHLVFGLALAYVLDKRLVTASVFAVIPDFDVLLNFLYPFVHRGIMHTVLAAGVAAGLVYLYTDDRESAESCFLGYSSHLALDLTTLSGVPLFFPFYRDIALSLTPAYSFEANMAFLAASLTAMIIKSNWKIFRPVFRPS